MAISDLFYLDAEGLHVADYEEVLEFYKNEYKRIYGDDAYLEADSQDGEWVAVQSLALFDTMQVSAAVYNSYSPSSSIGDALTRNVKINGLQRAIPSKSTATLYLTGTVGTVINNGYVKDNQGRKWFLPASTVIGVGGFVNETGTAEDEGALEALADSINIVGTPTKGWLTVNNPAAAFPGDPVEDDPDLRQRQSISTEFPSQSIFEGLVASIAALPGVTKVKGYENDTAGTVDGITEHTIAIVVEGGVDADIAEAIFNKKTTGCNTQGTTSVGVIDAGGISNTINFYRPTDVPIEVEVDAAALTGYLTPTGDLIAAAVAEYINEYNIGDNVLYTKLYTPANLPTLPEGDTFNITAIRIDTVASGSPVEADVPIAFTSLATSIVANITVNVT